jgi:hypothetical protein
MAKMTVTIDTETKEFDVSVDGESVPNANSVSVYQYGTPGDKYHEVSFEVSTYETVGTVRKMTRISASASPGFADAHLKTELGAPQEFTKAQASLVKAFNLRNRD